MYWSRSSAIRSRSASGPQAIARLKSAVNEVQRKPTQRLIWQSISLSEDLFPGEAVRTAGDAEAAIEFLKSGTVIELEPDSVIVIEEANGGVSLDFLQGNLSIHTDDGNAERMTVKSGDQAIVLNGGELNVGKEESGKLQLDVVKGDAKILAAGQQQPLNAEQDLLKVLQPAAKAVLYLRPNSDDKVDFSWQPIDPRYRVRLEAGKYRRKLRAIELPTPATGDAGALATALPFDTQWIRLSAAADGLPTLKSRDIPLTIWPKVPPVPLEPARDAMITPESADAPTVFRWANPGRLEKLFIEVARSADLKKEAIRKRVTEGEMSISIPVGAEGTVYWRIAGTLHGTETVVASEVRKFSFGKTVPQPLTAPVLSKPMAGFHLSHLSNVARGLVVEWQAVRGAERYEITLASSEARGDATDEVTETTATFRNLRPGTYRWRVKARASDGRVSPESEVRDVIIDGIGSLNWADGKTEGKNLYFAKTPRLAAEWSHGPEEARRWRYRFTNSREPAAIGEGESEGRWVLVQTPKFEADVPVDGVYRVEAEAVMEKDGKTVPLARAPVRLVEVKAAPLLPPPAWTSPAGKPLRARNNGSIDLNWRAVEGAQNYVLSVKEPGDGAQAPRTVSATTAALSRLAPGTYRVSLQSVDQGGRLSRPGEERTLVVPDTSDIQAPKIRKLDVK